MSSEQLPQKCNFRYKGVENFLRRLAFNLGNSPSQTEVKIISCIPIDVSDLQQKIISLEKELEEAKVNTQCHQNTVVQSVFCPLQHATPPTYHCRSHETSQTPHIEQCEGACLKHSGFLSSHESMQAPSPIIEGCTCCNADMSISQNNYQVPATEKRGFFRKSKKKKTKQKEKMQMVYYAQTENNPFTDSKYEKSNSVKMRDKSVNRTYIAEVIQKQYKTVPVAEEYAITSQFSSPICRDIEHTCERYSPNHCDADLCSCFRGTFHNIDLHNKNNNLPTCSYDTYNRNIKYYDTSLYDMVPERENPDKNPNLFYEAPKNKYLDCDLTPSCLPERRRQSYRYHPFIVNYSKISPTPHYYSQKPFKLANKRDKYWNTSPKRVSEKKVKKFDEDSSKSCSIDCGNIYTKKVNVDVKTQSVIEPLITVTHKNAECLTINVNDTECQTTTTQSVQIDNELLDDHKTEETLNEIKDILQTVLTEVKTNSQTKKMPDEKQTKDAVVQKGISHGNMAGCSELLQSYTYSPYNMNPYLASCSRQMNSRPYCFPNVPFPSSKCMQNFPVFIQNPGRNVCASCYRNSAHITKSTKQAATTATNTDSKERSTETEKLIKEIYKSLAVPTKENSLSEYDDLKSTRRQSHQISQQGSKSDIVVKNCETMSLRKTNLKNSSRSQIVSTTDTEKHLRKSRIDNYLKNLEKEKAMHAKIQENRIFRENSSSSSEDDEDDTASNDESEEQATAPLAEKKPANKGIFSKMFRRSVKIFGTKNKKKVEKPLPVENETDDECEDDSDEYQTVYSQRDTPRDVQYVHYRAQPSKMKTRSSREYRIHDRNQNKYKRTPYMEQEDRRLWNERLMFRDHRASYSSEGPRSRDMQSRNPIYWQNFDARCAVVDHETANFKRPPEAVPLRPQKKCSGPKVNVATKGMSWLKKHRPQIRCGEQWKKFILES